MNRKPLVTYILCDFNTLTIENVTNDCSKSITKKGNTLANNRERQSIHKTECYIEQGKKTYTSASNVDIIVFDV